MTTACMYGLSSTIPASRLIVVVTTSPRARVTRANHKRVGLSQVIDPDRQAVPHRYKMHLHRRVRDLTAILVGLFALNPTLQLVYDVLC